MPGVGGGGSHYVPSMASVFPPPPPGPIFLHGVGGRGDAPMPTTRETVSHGEREEGTVLEEEEEVIDKTLNVEQEGEERKDEGDDTEEQARDMPFIPPPSVHFRPRRSPRGFGGRPPVPVGTYPAEDDPVERGTRQHEYRTRASSSPSSSPSKRPRHK